MQRRVAIATSSTLFYGTNYVNSPRRVELQEPKAVGVVLRQLVEIRLRQFDDGGVRWPPDDDVGDGATEYAKRRQEEGGDGDGSHRTNTVR